MSTDKITESQKGVLATSQAPLISTFIAVILGASLMEFQEFLFPPKITSISFWALVVAYYSAIATWFGITTMSRLRPYTDTYLARVWVTCGVLMLTMYVGLMYFATQAQVSLFGYMWCWVIIDLFRWLSCFFRYLDLRVPEPLTLFGLRGFSFLLAAIAYTIWAQFFPPIPTIANWVFVFVAFVIVFIWRQVVRVRQQPISSEQH